MADKRKLYVVTAPAFARGIYRTWEECKAAVEGQPGARYQAVSSLAEANALLEGGGITLSNGVYAFADGNHMGGVGVVFVKQPTSGQPIVKEISTSVWQVFAQAGIPGLDSPQAIAQALASLRNILAELAGLYQALDHIKPGTRLTIVHDYEGVGAWLTGRWQTRDSLVTAIVAACRRLIADKHLTLSFRHQRSHQSTFAGRNDFIHFNQRADALATAGAKGAGPPQL